MANNKNNIRVGIDIGTSKVVCIIAENTSEGINVIGLGIQNSLGLRDGVIIDIESTVSAVKEAVSKAELMSGKQVTKAHVGISGGSVNGLNSSGAVPIKDKKVKMSKQKTKSSAKKRFKVTGTGKIKSCLLYTSPSPRDGIGSRMPSSA